MIREIINFTENLIEDIPDVMQWNIKPSRGIHIVVELDNEGQWVNKDNEMYLIDTNVNLNDIPSEALVQYEQLGLRVGTSMNKVLDNRKQIFSCSPFILSFKKKSLLNEKLEGVGIEKIIKLLPDYFSKAQELCKNERQVQLSKSFQNQCGEVLNFLHNKKILEKNKDGEIEVQILDRIKNDDYINLYLKNATFEEYRIVHNAYLQDKLFNRVVPAKQTCNFIFFDV
jgi:hypothetical protein